MFFPLVRYKCPGLGRQNMLVLLLICRLWIAGILVMAAADDLSITPTDNSIANKHFPMALRLTLNRSDLLASLNVANVIPLTASAGINLFDQERKDFLLRGHFVLANSTNYKNILPGSIIYLSCAAESALAGGQLTYEEPSQIVSRLALYNEPTAIVLFNPEGRACNLTSSPGTKLGPVYSINDRSEALAALEMVEEEGVYAYVTAIISTGDSPGKPLFAPKEPAKGPRIAMSILYSITGLITLLFFVVIVSGAVRASRYPEQYGPQEGTGDRPRQSRAKGLARAVLDTIPVIKFGGDSQQQQQRQRTQVKDLEMNPDMQDLTGGDHQQPQGQQQDQSHIVAVSENAEMVPSRDVQLASGANPGNPTAVPLLADPLTADEWSAVSSTERQEVDPAPGCVICTEDFLVGDDVRVLPCDHKFHPLCVDPWLINVSGTCPMCRLDLRPASSRCSESSRPEDTSMPPPLGNDAGVIPSSVPAHRRISRFFDLHMLRQASREERIQALRHMASQNSMAGGPDVGAPQTEEERNRRASITRRLRDRFRVRTTRGATLIGGARPRSELLTEQSVPGITTTVPAIDNVATAQ